MMVGLRAVHALCVFPAKVPQEGQHRDQEGHEVENRGGEEARDDGVVFGGKPEFGRNGGVDRNEGEPDDHAAWDGEEGIFCPDVRDECGFTEDGAKHCSIEGRPPDPMPRDFAITLGKIPEPDEL